jgi:hypothetical protein
VVERGRSFESARFICTMHPGSDFGPCMHITSFAQSGRDEKLEFAYFALIYSAIRRSHMTMNFQQEERGLCALCFNAYCVLIKLTCMVDKLRKAQGKLGVLSLADSK